MCWKQSWAHAINNIQHSIEYINKAEAKLKKRRERNESSLKKRLQKKNDRFEEKIIQERIDKNRRGEEQCQKLIADLQESQVELLKMIREYGISHSGNPKRIYKLMGRFPYEKY